MNKYIAIPFFSLSLVMTSHAFANSRCPANDMGCTNENMKEKVETRIEQGKQDVKQASGPINKAKEVGKTIKDCTDCATKVMVDSVEGATISK